ncbi:hypothetical protein [Pseudomonas luteola]|uniref:Uncharacterized protein n=1 Tax=Pseudomonas luteola TaxID=47886 RepID=A0ABS0MYX9_PSELU|nr:hypothetical protein [Pseudomonas luteola]MBH3441921.1 hypothetical protein [Pseudomonas luteola]
MKLDKMGFENFPLIKQRNSLDEAKAMFAPKPPLNHSDKKVLLENARML